MQKSETQRLIMHTVVSLLGILAKRSLCPFRCASTLPRILIEGAFFKMQKSETQRLIIHTVVSLRTIKIKKSETFRFALLLLFRLET